MRLDGYIRVSRVGGRSGESFISPEVQREQIARYADSHGHEVVAWHEDLDQSGGTINRPGFQAVLGRIERGDTDGIIVPKLDRFGRSVPRIYEALERIQSAGGCLLSVAEDFDLTTANGRAHFNLLGMMAQYQRDQATEAWDTSNRRAIERGIHFTNRPPFGYLRGEDRRLAPDPLTALLVQEMFRRRAGRESWRRIADWLNEVHRRSDGRDWSPRNIATMIQNRAYTGEAYHGKHRNPAAHDALVSAQEWEAANVVTGGPGAVRHTSSLLAGLIRCAGCRYAMRRTFTTYRNGRRVELYSCQVKHTGGRCPEPANVMAHVIEPYVTEQVLGFMGGLEWEVGGGDDDTGAEEVRRELERAEAHLASFLADDELREVVGREAYLAEARKRQGAVDAARGRAETAEAQRQRDDRRRHVLAAEWAAWQEADEASRVARVSAERDGRIPEGWKPTGHEGLRSETLRQVLDTIYVRKGRGLVSERVLLRWDGEDRYERPQRGTTTYKTRPIPWPDFAPNAAALASIPEWAWRQGHPAIPKDMVSELRSVARDQGAAQFLPEDALVAA
jgi:site-specific DNA recombinase